MTKRFIATAWVLFLAAYVQAVPYYHDQALLSVTVTEHFRPSNPVACRVRITHSGKVVKAKPEGAVAILYGLWDHADGYAFQPDSSFYCDGSFIIALPPGTYTVHLSKGLEYIDQEHVITLAAGESHQYVYHLERWIDMPQRGWYSADGHVHIRRSPREDPLLLTWLEAENINVGVMLRMGDFWTTYYQQYAWGDSGVYQRGHYLLTSGQEDPRTPELGHALGIGALDKVRYKNEYYYYDKVFDRIHALGGLTGYAHQGESFHGYRGLMLDALRNKVDMLEIIQFCLSENPLHTEHFYHLLDLGFAVTAIAGSDFPWCGSDHTQGQPEKSARIGNVRFYSYTGDTLTYHSWKRALKQGHTFATSGPMLAFTINNQLPGSFLRVSADSMLTISTEAFGHQSQVPLERIEIISHGDVIASTSHKDDNQSNEHLTLTVKIAANKSQWIAVRCYAGPKQVAHTTPVYILVNGKSFLNPATFNRYVQRTHHYLDELTKTLRSVNRDPEYQSWRYKKGLEKRIKEVKLILRELENHVGR